MFESFQETADRTPSQLVKFSQRLCLVLIVFVAIAVGGCAKEAPADPNIPKIEPGTKQLGPKGSVVPPEPKRR